MKTYPRIAEVPAGDDLCWYADDDCLDHADTLGEWIRSAEERFVDVTAGTIIRVAEKEFPSAFQFVPDYDAIIDMIAEAAGDHAAQDYADGYPEIVDNYAARVDLEELLEKWAEKHLPAPTWWICENVREYVINQADIDAAFATPGDSGHG